MNKDVWYIVFSKFTDEELEIANVKLAEWFWRQRLLNRYGKYLSKYKDLLEEMEEVKTLKTSGEIFAFWKEQGGLSWETYYKELKEFCSISFKRRKKVDYLDFLNDVICEKWNKIDELLDVGNEKEPEKKETVEKILDLLEDFPLVDIFKNIDDTNFSDVRLARVLQHLTTKNISISDIEEILKQLQKCDISETAKIFLADPRLTKDNMASVISGAYTGSLRDTILVYLKKLHSLSTSEEYIDFLERKYLSSF